MGAKVSLQALNCELREFFFRTLRVNHVFAVQFAEAFEHRDRAIGRISAQHRQTYAFAVGFEFLVFVVAGFPYLNRDLQDRTHKAKLQITQPGFDLYALGAVVVINVFDFVSDHGGEFVLAGHQVEPRRRANV